MTTPACRFHNGKDRCATHFDLTAGRRGEHYAALCDLGLAALCRQLDEQARVIGRLREAVTGALDLLDEAKAQWGEDYLWKKWGMSERIAELKALSPEPTEG